jgi:hypothetical protein
MVHAVIDTKGAGRIVGIFDDLERARRVAAIDPPYFRLVSVELNAVNPTAIEWLATKEKREALRSA